MFKSFHLYICCGDIVMLVMRLLRTGGISNLCGWVVRSTCKVKKAFIGSCIKRNVIL